MSEGEKCRVRLTPARGLGVQEASEEEQEGASEEARGEELEEGSAWPAERVEQEGGETSG